MQTFPLEGPCVAALCDALAVAFEGAGSWLGQWQCSQSHFMVQLVVQTFHHLPGL